jgi:hypothetical protein
MAAPNAVDVRTMDGGNLDARRWDGRSLLARSRTWRKLKAECVAYHSVLMRLKALKPTGNPSQEDIVRVASSMLNGKVIISEVLAAIENKQFVVDKLFQHLPVYDYLLRQHSTMPLLETGDTSCYWWGYWLLRLRRLRWDWR